MIEDKAFPTNQKAFPNTEVASDIYSPRGPLEMAPRGLIPALIQQGDLKNKVMGNPFTKGLGIGENVNTNIKIPQNWNPNR